MFGYLNWYAMDGYREFLFYVPFQQLLVIGPLVYLYTQSTLKLDKGLTWRNVWPHFVPGFVYLLYSIVAYLGDAWLLAEPYFYADGKDKDLLPWYQFVGLGSMVIYALMSLRLYRTYRIRNDNELSYSDSITLRWIQLFFIGLLATILLRAGFLLAFPQFGQFGVKYWYYLGFSILMFILTANGLGHLLAKINTKNVLHFFQAAHFAVDTQKTQHMQIPLRKHHRVKNG